MTPCRSCFARKRRRRLVGSRRWTSRAFLRPSSRSSPPCDRPSDMPTAIVHVAADDLQLTGTYEATGDVLYLSAAGDEKTAPAQQTPEGHAVRLDGDGRVTHLTAINARWLLDLHGELVATLRDGRRLRIDRQDIAELLP